MNERKKADSEIGPTTYTEGRVIRPTEAEPVPAEDAAKDAAADEPAAGEVVDDAPAEAETGAKRTRKTAGKKK